jgi:non-specific protein-tyrosine kinase
MKFEIALEKSKKLKLVKQNIVDNPGLKRPVPGSVPVYRFCKHMKLDQNKINKHICLGLKANAPEMDCYRILRTQILQRTRLKNQNTIMITSVLPGEGKTLTAINLALTFAKTQNHTALLVDSDLRRQQVHKYLGLQNDTGLTDYLNKNYNLYELIVWPYVEKFTFISGGDTIADSSELLGSVRMQLLVEDLKKRYQDRYIFFDSAPLLGEDDALTLSSWIDGIIMVVESHKTPMKQIEKALNLIPKDKFLGFVLNKHKTYSSKYPLRSSTTKMSKHNAMSRLKQKKMGNVKMQSGI